MDPTAKQVVVEYWQKKAIEALDSARAEAGAGRLSFAINRCYYALFYAASAVFLARDVRFVKHTGVRAAFHRDLVRTGVVAVEDGRFYDRMFQDRGEADYVDLVEFTPEEVDEDIAVATALVSKLAGLGLTEAPGQGS